MPFSQYLLLLLTHPLEFRTLVQYSLYHEPKRDITSTREHSSSGWDRESMRRCWGFLDSTGRSYSAVIKELEGDLARVICLFYLVLRALDTIEDDMTLDPSLKQSLLRNFHVHTVTPGWNFTGSGEGEKDRQLLVEYELVVEELGRLEPEYRAVILDITQKMASGMADFALLPSSPSPSTSNLLISIPTIPLYDLYCHYVAGLVGEALSRIFAASRKEQAWLADQLELSNNVGLLLQKTNIIRDFREDVEEGRAFWPREIWGKYGFDDVKQLYVGAAPPSRSSATLAVSENEKSELGALAVDDRALYALSEMVLDALRHATDALDYLRSLRNQSCFNFCAIPVTMALATLEMCFMNRRVFGDRAGGVGGKVKIRKAAAVSMIMRSTNLREVAYIIRDYTRKIHAKAVSADPNFIRLSVACGKVEQWCEHHYPSFVQISDGSPSLSLNPLDARTRIVHHHDTLDRDIARKKRIEELRDGVVSKVTVNGGNLAQEKGFTWEIAMYLLAAFAVVSVLGAGIVWLVIVLG